MRVWAVVDPQGGAVASSVKLTAEGSIIAFLANDRVEKLTWAACVGKDYGCEEFLLTPTGERNQGRELEVSGVDQP